ncbi:MAG: NifU family protein [Elusimicrobiota bacterium]|nr:NifU family protein [Endomicrobiia bacterium]MDW8165037.1 NifU family protein [Elusimicrobiota bacterium]
MKQKIKQKIEEIRPMLQRDGGDVEIVEITDEGIVKVKLTGTCAHCAMSLLTLKMGIEGYLKKNIPEVKSVESV